MLEYKVILSNKDTNTGIYHKSEYIASISKDAFNKIYEIVLQDVQTRS